MLQNLRIRTKILFLKVPFIITLVLVTIISVFGMAYITENTDEMYNLAECANKVSRMQGIIFQRQRLMRSVGFVLDDDGAVDDLLEILTTNNNLFVQYISELKENLNYDEAQAILEEMDRNYTSYFEEWSIYLSFVEAKDAQSVTDASFNAGQGGLELQLMCESLVDILVNQTDLLKASSDRYEFLILGCTIIFSIIALIAAILFGEQIARLITKPVYQLLTTAEKLAKGDINSQLTIQSKDELGELAYAYNKMVESIYEQAMVIQTIAKGDYTVDIQPRSQEDIINISIEKLILQNTVLLNKVQKATEEIYSLSEQVANTSQKLASGTSEQALSIEELLVSLQQISEEAQSNENSALENATNGRLLYNIFVQSNQYIDKMKEAMAVIYNSSADVAQVIHIIEDIAFKSNILAINAGIEAAHADESSKSFTVIAEEYRNLSISIGDAAKQSAELIDKCITSIHLGGTVLDNMLSCLVGAEQYQKTHSSLTEKILKASERQNDSMKEISHVSAQIKEVVVDNSSTSEETAVIAEEMNAQVQNLNNLIRNFKFNNDIDIEIDN